MAKSKRLVKRPPVPQNIPNTENSVVDVDAIAAVPSPSESLDPFSNAHAIEVSFSLSYLLSTVHSCAIELLHIFTFIRTGRIRTSINPNGRVL